LAPDAQIRPPAGGATLQAGSGRLSSWPPKSGALETRHVSMALFDLDNTLLGGDSDYLWGEFLTSIGAVDEEAHRRENARFFDQYRSGTLDIDAFLSFQLKPLADNALEDLLAWRERFVSEWIAPLVLARGRELIEEHRRKRHWLAIVTSTNAFITRPIADLFGIVHLLATEPEFDGSRYTGAYVGVPCSGDGKVHWVKDWAARNALTLTDSWFYGDSHQDIPLLTLVDHPVAVDPDDTLRGHAKREGWPVISLR
jgi:HAD superfamily hydrolase (TIGR01490 family)